MSRDKISYEWCIECADEHGDIGNVDHADSLADALLTQKMWSDTGDYHSVAIALSRTEGNDDDGINWRGYSYLRDDGTLEPTFSTYHAEDGPADDGPDVPQRFHKEVAATPTPPPCNRLPVGE